MSRHQIGAKDKCMIVFLSGLVVLRVNYCHQIIIVSTKTNQVDRNANLPSMSLKRPQNSATRQVKKLHSPVFAPSDQQPPIGLEVRAMRDVAKARKSSPHSACVRVDNCNSRTRGGRDIVRCKGREAQMGDGCLLG